MRAGRRSVLSNRSPARPPAAVQPFAPAVRAGRSVAPERLTGGDRMLTLATYKQVLDPVGESLFASTIFAVLPLVTLFVLLGGLRLKAHLAALAALAVALL